MHNPKHNPAGGFTLLEMVVSASLGLLVLLAMTSLFKMGMNASYTISQRAEVQQNMRAAIELMTKDIGYAGSGLPTGGIQLATASVSNYGCYGATCYLANHSYPNDVGAGTPNYMYGIIPGYSNGVESAATIPNASAARNDSITTIYEDYSFPLDNFTFTLNSTTQVTATLNATPIANEPTNILAPGGLTVGDVLLFYVSESGTAAGVVSAGTSQVQNAAVVADITGISGGSSGPWVLTFSTGDSLNMNQTGGADNLASAFGYASSTMKVYRLEVVSYFLEVPAAGGTVQTPRLMRQVNGLQANPVADNIVNLQFSYDVIDAYTGYLSANLPNPVGSGESPNLIQKVNIWIMGEDINNSQISASGISHNHNSVSMYLITSVAAGNMSFCNSFGYSSTACAND